jgi:CRP-like cAMP-binding protein
MKTLKPNDEVKTKYIGKVPLFRSLSQKEKLFLAQNSFIQAYEKNEFIFREMGEGNTLYILLRGTVQIFLHLPSGNKKILHLVQPPSLLAEGAVLTGKPFPANGQTMGECLIIALNRQTLFELTKSNPQMPWNIMGGMFSRLKEFKETIENQTRKSAISRVAIYFLSIAPNCCQVVLPAPKKEIANYLGLRPESFSRALRSLIEKGVITVKDNGISISNRSALERILQE